MNFEPRWIRPLGKDQSGPPRRREAWQLKHDQVFHAVWGQQPKRHFPAPPPEPRPISQFKRKPINWRALMLFLVGVGLGWLLSR